jgi:hypothetical protein
MHHDLEIDFSAIYICFEGLPQEKLAKLDDTALYPLIPWVLLEGA